MDDSTLSIQESEYSCKEIGRELLSTLEFGNEELEDFLIDWAETSLCWLYDTEYDSSLLFCNIKGTPEYKQLLRIGHFFAQECQRSRYIESGIDWHPSLTISEFLTEIFRRYRCRINPGASVVKNRNRQHHMKR